MHKLAKCSQLKNVESYPVLPTHASANFAGSGRTRLHGKRNTSSPLLNSMSVVSVIQGLLAPQVEKWQTIAGPASEDDFTTTA